jgi:hypothetical protein
MEEACFLFLMNEIGRGGRKRPRQTEIEAEEEEEGGEGLSTHKSTSAVGSREDERRHTGVTGSEGYGRKLRTFLLGCFSSV